MTEKRRWEPWELLEKGSRLITDAPENPPPPPRGPSATVNIPVTKILTPNAANATKKYGG